MHGPKSSRLLRSLSDLVIQMTSLVIALELTTRSLIELMQHFAQLHGFGVTRRKALSVYFSQRADESVSVLVTNLTVLIPIPEVRFFHATFPCSQGQHLPGRTGWQPPAGFSCEEQK